MIKITATFIFTVIGFITYCQSLTNENFESWIDNSAFIDPEGWVTLNDFNAEFGLPITVLKSTDAHEGSFAAHMQTYTFKDGNNNTDTLPSALVYGTDVNSGVTYSWPKRLKTISFYYKYKPNGIDTGLMYLTIGYRDKKTNRYINQGGAYFLFAKKTDAYTKATLPVYYNSNHKCDTFVLAFINSVENANGNRRKPGTVLLIDDIDTYWEEFPAVAIQSIQDLELNAYPNPATDRINLIGLNPAYYFIKIMDMMGKIVVSESLMNESVNIEKLNSGFYHLVIYSADGSHSGSLYFIKK